MDFSAIEARALAWLSGEEKVLQIFRGDANLYEHTACDIYSVPLSSITKDMRLIGKVAALALGYQGGVGAFQALAKAYALKIDDKLAETIKKAWREKNQNIVQYWYDCERAAIDAVKNKGTSFSAGAEGRHVTYKCAGSFLLCKLPSGRVIVYPYPKLVEITTPWGQKKLALTYFSVVSQNAKKLPDEMAEALKNDKEVWESNRWRRQPCYGGLLVENICQSVARDLLADAMLRVDALGYKIVLHVHDEIVVEIPGHFGESEKSLLDIKKIMSTPPEWAKNLPLGSEGWAGQRYRK
jgi:DNA polymerase